MTNTAEKLMLLTCPICEEESVVKQMEPIVINGVTVLSHYKSCSSCGSDFVDAEDALLNKNEIINKKPF